MSIRCQSWVYQHSETTGNDRLVLLAIADEADDDGTHAYPAIDTIAHKARVPKRTTMRCLERLETAGALEVIRPEKRGRGHFNSYRVLMGLPENDATLAPFSEGEKARKGARPYSDRSRPIDPKEESSSFARDNEPSPFERFYEVYPRKVARAAAERAWKSATRKAHAETIIAGAARYAAECRMLNRDVLYIAYPASWLNAGRWDDEPTPPPTNGNGRVVEVVPWYDR